MATDFVKRSPNIEDKVCLVTGGAAGVGAGVVRALLSENARHVTFLDIAVREGASLELELTTKFGALRAKFIECDVSDDEQLSAAYNKVLEKYRRLDVVINNAAVLSVCGHGFKRMIDVNFTGTVYSTVKAMDAMGVDKGGVGGTVVNISSLLALNLGSHLPSEECYKRTQVRVLTVCLGPTDTAILQRVASAVNGIIQAINQGASGSTWIVENDKPAYDFSEKIAGAFQILSKT
ncbi:putative alcohol dehydrogenase [Operophtera brumata]|uniref:Putative alcohol dehydrogenase n=1 Tax=Operophtera brumata TaxID=104452 RepID=A0A0L7L646_OPEBR|nr:putative alcohol dehydrogenase [Operophtera brumata]